MPELPAPAELLRDLAGVLSRWGGRWFLCGAQAVNVWGSPRPTADADVTTSLAPRDPTAFVLDMIGSGFGLCVDDVEEFVARTSVLPFVHRRTRMPFDVVLAETGLKEYGAGLRPEVTSRSAGGNRSREAFAVLYRGSSVLGSLVTLSITEA